MIEMYLLYFSIGSDEIQAPISFHAMPFGSHQTVRTLEQEQDALLCHIQVAHYPRNIAAWMSRNVIQNSLEILFAEIRLFRLRDVFDLGGDGREVTHRMCSFRLDVNGY